jgi:hypothetical protein
MKKRRPGTRGGGRRESIGETDPFERVTLPRPAGGPATPARAKAKAGRLPSDIADAAEAALDDMLARTDDIDDDDILDEEPKTQTRSPSHEVIERDDDDDEILAAAPKPAVAASRHSKMPLPAPPATTSVQTLGRGSPYPAGQTPTRPSPVPSRPHVIARPSPVPTRPTPTGPPTPLPGPMMAPIPAPTRLRSAPTLGDTPLTRGEYTTSDRSLETATEMPTHSNIDETAPVPDELIMDLQSAPVELPIDFDQEAVAETEQAIPRPELASLQVVVFEESAHLGSLQSTITAAGHIVGVAATGRDGVPRVLEALREDEDHDINVVIAALPGGEAIIDAALALEPRPVVIASFGCGVLDAVNRAHVAGADLAITRPHDVERIAPMMFAAARLYLEQRASRATTGTHSIDDDTTSYEPRSLLALDVFQRVIEREIKRAKKFEYALCVAMFAVEFAAPAPPPGIRGIVRARAGNALLNALRDIDMATQLDDERFLVVLPYTDLKAAAAVGRRVIAAVADGDPVISAGRRFPPRVVGAIAGAMPGQPMTYAKLIKDATRTLDQARRDGAELAVQP